MKNKPALTLFLIIPHAGLYRIGVYIRLIVGRPTPHLKFLSSLDWINGERVADGESRLGYGAHIQRANTTDECRHRSLSCA
jgi:hypothetical protein